MNNKQNRFVKFMKISLLTVSVIIFTLFVISTFKAVAATNKPAETGSVIMQHSDKVITWGFVSAAGVVGLGSIAAGIAVAYVGSAALGAIGEKPDLFGRALIFVALAEGIAIYGVIIAMMILGKLG